MRNVEPMFPTKAVPLSPSQTTFAAAFRRTRQAGARALKRVSRSLRARLVLIVVAIDCLAALLTGSVVVWNAQTATKAEIASAMQLAQGLVADTLRLMQDAPAPILLQSIDLHFQSVAT